MVVVAFLPEVGMLRKIQTPPWETHLPVGVVIRIGFRVSRTIVTGVIVVVLWLIQRISSAGECVNYLPIRASAFHGVRFLRHIDYEAASLMTVVPAEETYVRG